ncbi:DUF4259 domain-containing protein [Streptomyces sp. NPDC059256]|uniref:DUF4259 domain-containing protein n=1 Tax=Streptomyces sp. NPDC059256 TaxID=3346794 RepID=UPI0036D066BD
MGTWDIGHFDNDTAADFGGTIDDTPADQRAELLADLLRHVTATEDFLDSDDGAQAIAAAALIAAQCPGGEPVTTAYGPKEALPELPVSLRPLAVGALDRVLAEDSELVELWGETSDIGPWRKGVESLRQTLSEASA